MFPVTYTGEPVTMEAEQTRLENLCFQIKHAP